MMHGAAISNGCHVDSFVTEYALRLNGSGRFSLPPTRVEAMYSPDIRGSLPNAPVVVGVR